MKYSIWVAALILPALASGNIMLTSPAGGTTTVYPIQGSAYQFTQPLLLGSFSVTGDGFLHGWGEFNLSGNGNWSPFSNQFGWFGASSATRTVTIDLGQNYTSAAVFMNYNPSYGVYMKALDAAMTVLETYYLPTDGTISVSGTNQGANRGITRTQNDIRYLQFTGGDIAIHSVTVQLDATPPPDPAPEPATIGTCLLALSIIFSARRRR